MRKLLLILALACAAPFANVGCQTAPTERTQTVTTLKAIGAARDTAMKVAAQMKRDGTITQAQWDTIAEFHDRKLQPAYRVAVLAVKSDLSSFASPDLLALWTEFFALISSFTAK